MIFCSKNEAGVPAWKLVLSKQKTVTRRIKPVEVGKIVSVQPNRGVKSVCKIKIKSCVFEKTIGETVKLHDLENEAHREGFLSWSGLLNWLEKNGASENVYRIEFVKVKN